MVNIIDSKSGRGGDSSGNTLIGFEAVDVTSTRQLEARNVQRSAPAGAVARALAASMELPDNVPWSIRSQKGRILEDDRAIGEQLVPGERVTVTPRTHLGAPVSPGSFALV